MNKLLSLLLSVVLLTACTKDPVDVTGTIAGIVTEQSASSTEPLAGVTVSITSLGKSTITGSDGSFTFGDIVPDSYALSFAKSGYVSDTHTVTVVAGQTAKCDMTLARTADNALISISPATLNFGTTQTEMTVTIANNGNSQTSWSLDLGNNAWLSASPKSGRLAAGSTQAIVLSVDRSLLSDAKSVIVNVAAYGSSFPISVSCAPRNATPEMAVSPTAIEFGAFATEQPLTIRNTGSGTLAWSIANSTSPAISFSEQSGTVSPGGNKVVKVYLDRTLISGAFTTLFTVSDGMSEHTVTVSANGGNTGGDTPDDPIVDPSGTVVTQGLTAYFKFDGNLDDSGENSISCYGMPEPTFVTGVTSDTQAARFSRVDKNTVNISHPLIDTRTMTVSFWVKGLGDGNIFYATSSKAWNSNYISTTVMMSLSCDGGQLKYVMGINNNQTYNSSAYERTGNFTHKPINDDKWHHIVLTSDYSNINNSNVTTSLYIDGQFMDTVLEKNSYGYELGTGIRFVLGGDRLVYTTTFPAASMTVANFRVYDSRLLSPEEIKTIYQAKQ